MDAKIVLQDSDRELKNADLESEISGSPDNIQLNRTGKKPVLKV
jgi:hypothetical protein